MPTPPTIQQVICPKSCSPFPHGTSSLCHYDWKDQGFTWREQSERGNGKKKQTSPKRPTPHIEIRREEKGETECRLIHDMHEVPFPEWHHMTWAIRQPSEVWTPGAPKRKCSNTENPSVYRDATVLSLHGLKLCKFVSRWQRAGTWSARAEDTCLRGIPCWQRDDYKTCKGQGRKKHRLRPYAC